MEMESCSEGESDVETKVKKEEVVKVEQKSAAKISPRKSAEKNSPKKSGAKKSCATSGSGSAGKPKQASIMNFFSKK
jgi:hypothetical protein